MMAVRRSALVFLYVLQAAQTCQGQLTECTADTSDEPVSGAKRMLLVGPGRASSTKSVIPNIYYRTNLMP